MSDSQTPATPPIPVICDQCRATGMAGDAAFAGIPDLLDFTPVPRRAHANGWTAEHQRAFIAALAITGSARQAARHVGRAAFGAEQLRTAKGGRSFAAAWDAALDLARDRELALLHGNLADLAAKVEADNAKARADGSLVPGDHKPDTYWNGGYTGPEEDSDEIEEVRKRIWYKLQRLQKRHLLEIAQDPAKRAAWDLVNEPVDWEALENGTWTETPYPENSTVGAEEDDEEDGSDAAGPGGEGRKLGSPPPAADESGQPDQPGGTPKPKDDGRSGPRVRRL